MNPQSFHFLRPEWLLALLLLVPLGGLAWRRRDANGWERICEPHLLPHLVVGGGVRRAGLPLAAFALGWVAACLALAGPTWERLPQLAFEDPSRTVFVLGLAPSMDARDVAPSRIARARHKLKDALDRLGAGSAALVVYREEAFAATPLTNDLQVLRELVPLLETNLTPGGRVLPARGIEEAARLLEPVGLTGADILLVTDGTDTDPKATLAAAAAAAHRGARVSVLGLAGTSRSLEEIAESGDGSFAALTADDRDLAKILDARELPLATSLSKSERRADAWRDMGVWLVWVPLLLAPLAFRKGWATAALAVLLLQLPTGAAQAGVLDWFERADQRGARAFAQQQYESSAAAFENPAWRAAALYRAGDFESAAAELTDRSDPESSYNRGNALARAGRLEEALAAYDAALAQKADDPDARFNRDLVKRLLEEQEPPASNDASQSGGSESGDSESSGSDARGSEKAEPNAGAADEAGAAGGSEDGDTEQSSPSQADSSADSPDASAAEGAPNDAEQSPGPADSDPAAGTGQAAMEPADPGGDTASHSEASAGADSGERAESPAGSARPLSPTPGADVGSMSREEQEAARWMARLPDDPGGLLREKIRRDFLRKRLVHQQGGQP